MSKRSPRLQFSDEEKAAPEEEAEPVVEEAVEEIAEETAEEEIDFDEVSMAETKRIDLDV